MTYEESIMFIDDDNKWFGVSFTMDTMTNELSSYLEQRVIFPLRSSGTVTYE